MENKPEEKKGGVVIGLIAFFSSIISVFVMYYIFAAISAILGIIGLRKENSRAISITSLIIVSVTFVVKMITVLLDSGALSEALTKGLF